MSTSWNSLREIHLLRRLPTGEALLLTNEKRLHICFEASEVEHLLATTDRSEMAQWPERCAHDPEFARLLHRLGLDDSQGKYTTVELPELAASNHQDGEG